MMFEQLRNDGAFYVQIRTLKWHILMFEKAHPRKLMAFTCPPLRADAVYYIRCYILVHKSIKLVTDVVILIFRTLRLGEH